MAMPAAGAGRIQLRQIRIVRPVLRILLFEFIAFLEVCSVLLLLLVVLLNNFGEYISGLSTFCEDFFFFILGLVII